MYKKKNAVQDLTCSAQIWRVVLVLLLFMYLQSFQRFKSRFSKHQQLVININSYLYLWRVAIESTVNIKYNERMHSCRQDGHS